MLQNFILNYPEEVLQRLYHDYNVSNMGIYTFEEFCFVRYGSYIADYHFNQRKARTNLLLSTYGA